MLPSIEEVKEILAYLKSVDLMTIEYSEIRKRTDILVKVGFMGVEFPEYGNKYRLVIYRGRVLKDVSNLFVRVDQISYPPLSEDGNSTLTLNRASTNKFQTFYGAVEMDDPQLDQLTAMVEV